MQQGLIDRFVLLASAPLRGATLGKLVNSDASLGDFRCEIAIVFQSSRVLLQFSAFIINTLQEPVNVACQ